MKNQGFELGKYETASIISCAYMAPLLYKAPSLIRGCLISEACTYFLTICTTSSSFRTCSLPTLCGWCLTDEPHTNALYSGKNHSTSQSVYQMHSIHSNQQLKVIGPTQLLLQILKPMWSQDENVHRIWFGNLARISKYNILRHKIQIKRRDYSLFEIFNKALVYF